MAPIPFRGSCLRDNKEENEKRRKQDEKRLEIQCIIHLNQKSMLKICCNNGLFMNFRNIYFMLLLYKNNLKFN